MLEDPQEVADNPALPTALQRRWTARLGWAGAISAMALHGALMLSGRNVRSLFIVLPIFVVGFISVPAILRRGGSGRLATGLLLGFLLAWIVTAAAMGGGLRAPILALLPVLTVVAVLLSGTDLAGASVFGAAISLLGLALWQTASGSIVPLNAGQLLRAGLLFAGCAAPLLLATLYDNELQRVRRALRAASTSDPLTGLANRDSLDDVLALEHHRLSRHPAGSLSIILFAIDQFEEYGLTHGRQAADELVRKVADTARLRVRRAPDILGRQGDDELLAVLPATGGPDAAAVAECIRRDIEALALPTSAAPGGVVTVSLGVAAEVAGDERSIDSLLTEAGRSLRQAKLAGGNRVEVAPTASEPA